VALNSHSSCVVRGDLAGGGCMISSCCCLILSNKHRNFILREGTHKDNTWKRTRLLTTRGLDGWLASACHQVKVLTTPNIGLLLCHQPRLFMSCSHTLWLCEQVILALIECIVSSPGSIFGTPSSYCINSNAILYCINFCHSYCIVP